jgi:hypothetical protein
MTYEITGLLAIGLKKSEDSSFDWLLHAGRDKENHIEGRGNRNAT